MTDSCATCFFGQTGQNFNVGGLVRRRVCRKDTPVGERVMTAEHHTWLWPPVADDDWCGEGMDKDSHVSYSPAAVPP